MIAPISQFYMNKVAQFFEILPLQNEISRLANEVNLGSGISTKWRTQFFYNSEPIAVAASPNMLYISSGMLSLVNSHRDLAKLTYQALGTASNKFYILGSSPDHSGCRLNREQVDEHHAVVKHLGKKNVELGLSAEQFVHTYAAICWANIRLYSGSNYFIDDWQITFRKQIAFGAAAGISPAETFDFIKKQNLLNQASYFGDTLWNAAMMDAVNVLEWDRKNWDVPISVQFNETMDPLPFFKGITFGLCPQI